MSEVNPWQRAAIYRNPDFILIETQSGHRVSIADPDGSMHFLDTAADDEALGRCLNDALLASRFITPQHREENPLFFDFRLVGENYKNGRIAFLPGSGTKPSKRYSKK
ncbi:hypothetical protein BGC_23690 [Burkholderia sp. 3C]